MRTPARILRAEARTLAPERAPVCENYRARHQTILNLSKTLMARHGSSTITFKNLAIALDISTTTLRRHFADLDALLGEILRTHLLALANAIGDIPLDAQNRRAQQRAAYHAFTHTEYGALSDAHLLLTRDTRHLPDDERIPIEQTHQNFGTILAPTCPQEALLLLDSTLTQDRIETMLAPLLPPPAPDKQPAKKPTLPVPPSAPDEPNEKPGAWIFTAGIPLKARAPPSN